jgi:hypothetical protein
MNLLQKAEIYKGVHNTNVYMLRCVENSNRLQPTLFMYLLKD